MGILYHKNWKNYKSGIFSPRKHVYQHTIVLFFSPLQNITKFCEQEIMILLQRWNYFGFEPKPGNQTHILQGGYQAWSNFIPMVAYRGRYCLPYVFENTKEQTAETQNIMDESHSYYIE